MSRGVFNIGKNRHWSWGNWLSNFSISAFEREDSRARNRVDKANTILIREMFFQWEERMAHKPMHPLFHSSWSMGAQIITNQHNDMCNNYCSRSCSDQRIIIGEDLLKRLAIVKWDVVKEIDAGEYKKEMRRNSEGGRWIIEPLESIINNSFSWHLD